MPCPALRVLLLLLIGLTAPAWAESTSEFYASRTDGVPAARGLRFAEGGEVDTRGAFPPSANTSANTATPTAQSTSPAPSPPAAGESSGIWSLVAAGIALALCIGMFSATRLLRGRTAH